MYDSRPPLARYVWYVTWYLSSSCCSEPQIAHVQLCPFCHLSTLDVTHLRKHTRPFAFFRATESGTRAWERGYCPSVAAYYTNYSSLVVGQPQLQSHELDHVMVPIRSPVVWSHNYLHSLFTAVNGCDDCCEWPPYIHVVGEGRELPHFRS